MINFTGKSSLAIQFVQGQFVDYYEPTIENSKKIQYNLIRHLISSSIIGVEFQGLKSGFLLTAFNKTVNINGLHYDLLLVDTAGQDEYTIFPAEYSVDVNGYVLVYSIDSPHSFEVCKNIHEKLMDLLGIRKYEKCMI